MEPITKEYLRAVSSENLKKEMADPVRREEITNYLNNRGAVLEIIEDLTNVQPNSAIDQFNQDEQQTQEQIDQAAKAEEDRLAAEAQIEAAKAAEVIKAAEPPKKIILEYQVYDEVTGKPLGRPTHLEAYSWEEMSQKQKEAHTQATRAFHRLKNQKTTFKPLTAPVSIPDVPLLSEQDRIQAALDLNSDDEQVVIKADRKLRADAILREQQQEAINKEKERQRLVSEEFKRTHANDFNPCLANGQLIGSYIKDNNLEWTSDNLELAFAAMEPQLAPREEPVADDSAQTVETNDPAQVQTATQPAATTAGIQPSSVAAAPVVPAAAPAAITPAATARPGVNAGIVPGQMSAQRQVQKPAGLTMKDIRGWTGEQMRKERSNPARRAEIDRVIAAHNKARATRV